MPSTTTTISTASTILAASDHRSMMPEDPISAARTDGAPAKLGIPAHEAARAYGHRVVSAEAELDRRLKRDEPDLNMDVELRLLVPPEREMFAPVQASPWDSKPPATTSGGREGYASLPATPWPDQLPLVAEREDHAGCFMPLPKSPWS
jgi:hypothetical protein